MADESDSSPAGDIPLEPDTTPAPPRSRGLWAVVAVIAVVAGAVVATSGGNGVPPRLPLALGAGGGGKVDAAAPTGSSLSIAPVTYVAGEGLPGLGGEAPAYRLEGSVDAARVTTLARALGLGAAPVHADRLWRVTSGDAILEVSDDGGGSWWYSPTGGVVSGGGGSSSTGSAGTGCAPSPDGACSPPQPSPVEPTTEDAAPADCPPNAGCTTPTCPPDAVCAQPVEPPPFQPTPPVDLPSKDAAQKRALELLAKTGLDVADVKVTVDGPYDSWFVTVEPTIDGMVVSGWVSSVAIGSKGVVTSASGTLGSAAKLDRYPLVDTRAAIDRLNKQGGHRGGGPVPMGAPDGVARDAVGVASEPPATAASGCVAQPDGSEVCQTTGTGVVPPACGTPAPQLAPVPAPDGSITTLAPAVRCPEPVPYEPPVPIEVVLTGAEQILAVEYAIDGSNEAYLVPAYRFSSAEGNNNPEVVAVVDDSLAPTTTTPSPSTPPETPRKLAPGETAEIGVGYYVDVNTHCGTIVFADRWWATDSQTPLSWSTPTEGGTFTLKSSDEGVFVGDAEGTKTAAFAAKGPAAELPLCG